MSNPFVWVYDDPARGLALLRGARTPELLEAAELVDLARWSVSGRGHVLARVHLPDLRAHGQRAGIPIRVVDRPGDGAPRARTARTFHDVAQEAAKELLAAQRAVLAAWRRNTGDDGLCTCPAGRRGDLPPTVAELGAVELGHEHHRAEVAP